MPGHFSAFQNMLSEDLKRSHNGNDSQLMMRGGAKMITKFFVARNAEWDSNVTPTLIGLGKGPIQGGGRREANIEKTFEAIYHLLESLREKRQKLLVSLLRNLKRALQRAQKPFKLPNFSG